MPFISREAYDWACLLHAEHVLVVLQLRLEPHDQVLVHDHVLVAVVHSGACHVRDAAVLVHSGACRIVAELHVCRRHHRPHLRHRSHFRLVNLDLPLNLDLLQTRLHLV